MYNLVMHVYTLLTCVGQILQSRAWHGNGFDHMIEDLMRELLGYCKRAKSGPKYFVLLKKKKKSTGICSHHLLRYIFTTLKFHDKYEKKIKLHSSRHYFTSRRIPTKFFKVKKTIKYGSAHSVFFFFLLLCLAFIIIKKKVS